MKAQAASDPNGVEYEFECVTDSTWSSALMRSNYWKVKVGLSGHEPAFRFKVRDGSLNFNETEWSTTETAPPYE